VLPRPAGEQVFDLYHDAVTLTWVLDVAHDERAADGVTPRLAARRTSQGGGAMHEEERTMHTVVEVLGADGISVMMELGRLIGLQRLLHAEEKQLTGRHGYVISAAVGEDGVNQALAWRWAGEQETMEWQPLPFWPKPEGEGE
jgi:hypothetical protein